MASVRRTLTGKAPGFHSEGEGLSIGGDVTIDSSTGANDNGALACMRTAWSNPMSDSSTTQAVSNLLSVARRRDTLNLNLLVMVGHGNEGLITTGSGQGSLNPGTYLSIWNQSGDWGPQLQRLAGKTYTMLTLLACDTGANSDGATLLSQVANASNHTVRARTGLVNCGGGSITYQDGSTWQMATPGAPAPTPIPWPSPPPGSKVVVMRKGRAWQTVQIAHVQRVSYVGHPPGRGAVELTGASAQDVASLVDFAHPVSGFGNPLARFTGTFTVDIAVGKQAATVQFHVYNYRILTDRRTGVSYLASAELRNALISLVV
jgi:hypothetical protein